MHTPGRGGQQIRAVGIGRDLLVCVWFGFISCGILFFFEISIQSHQPLSFVTVTQLTIIEDRSSSLMGLLYSFLKSVGQGSLLRSGLH